MVGVLPALLVLYIRRNVPESPSWSAQAAATRQHVDAREVALAPRHLCGGPDDGVQLLQPRHAGPLSDLPAVEHSCRRMPSASSRSSTISARSGGIMFGALSERIGRRRRIVIAALLWLPVMPLWAFRPRPRAGARRLPDADLGAGRLGHRAGASERTVARTRAARFPDSSISSATCWRPSTRRCRPASPTATTCTGDGRRRRHGGRRDRGTDRDGHRGKGHCPSPGRYPRPRNESAAHVRSRALEPPPKVDYRRIPPAPSFPPLKARPKGTRSRTSQGVNEIIALVEGHPNIDAIVLYVLDVGHFGGNAVFLPYQADGIGCRQYGGFFLSRCAFAASTHHVSRLRSGERCSSALPPSPIGLPSADSVCAIGPTAMVLETTTMPISESVPCHARGAGAEKRPAE